ncbi:MAG: ABC transporter permease [Cytophagales bacterium]|nr:MAG: ABC transporter permease [Cytophagales bacterium]
MKLSWWKYITIFLIYYSVLGGLVFEVPRLPILNETVRNLYYHVPLWFGMIIILLISMINAIKYLKTNDLKYDTSSIAFAEIGIFYGILGIITGSIWAKFTWGSFWTNDPKLNAAAIGLLIYFAYLILRGSVTDETQKARISAVYNIFSYLIFIPLIFVLPRLVDSLHPGNGGNPGFNSYDLDSKMRMVFYPAVIAWTLLGVWISQIVIFYKNLKLKSNEE